MNFSMFDPVQLLFWGSVVTNFLLVGVLLSFVTKHKKILDELLEFKDRNKDVQKAQEMVNQARDDSREILSEAHEKADQVVASASTVGRELKEKLGEEIEKVVDETQEELSTEAKKEISQLRAQVSAKLDEELERVRQEAENYKGDQIKQIDQRLKVILEPLAQEILGRDINLKEHEELVLKKLEEARRDNVL